ncbi:dynamin family protein [Domibacillus sp. A3M-37]|uniref:dynamin family protein n=1 Tax=Domibacillus sp. A3M-37 TaxID=2962037 RepID=UPI0020B64A44|nr:dynamin family protein [Domibacillus sp. A3M-37]MCP3764577.1 dynamin family protein [Domibacillus sp. A3M-37]
MLSLEQFRDERLRISKEELAYRLNISTDKLEFLEQNPGLIDLSFLVQLSQLSGYSIDDIIQFKPQEILLLDVKDSYSKWDERLSQMKKSLERATEIFKKPKIAFFGPSDAGKSTLINSLCGQKVLVSRWTPLTSSVVHLKHVADKPKWMGSDEVMVLQEPSEGRLDYDLLLDEEYCKKLKIDSGKLEITRNHISRDYKGEILSKAHHTLIFVDAPILKTCDLLDSPGYGTEVKGDTEHAKRLIKSMDAMVYMCQSNGFLNKKEDVDFFIKSTKQLPNLEHLFVVASQAQLIGEKNVPLIMKRAISATINMDLHQTWNLEKEMFRKKFSNRFFTYSLESEVLRSRFERAMTNFLELEYPELLSRKVQQEVPSSFFALLSNS